MSTLFNVEHEPLVSIVTVNFNEPEVTRDMLVSVFNNSYKNIEVIVVDNGCSKKVDNIVRTEYPTVTYIDSAVNLGFAGGNNLGIAVAKGEYVFLVNNDTVFTDGLVEALLNRFSANDKIGVVSPKIRYHHTPEMIQYAGYTKVNPFTARNRALGSKEIDKGQCDKAIAVPYGHGAALMVRKQVIQQVGMLPELFFLYYEELDWCEQITRAGFSIWYEPKALIYHKESVSVGKMSAFKTYYLTRNRLLFVRRNMRFAQKMIFVGFFIGLTIPKNTLQFMLKRQWQHLKSFWSGILWNLSHRSKTVI